MYMKTSTYLKEKKDITKTEQKHLKTDIIPQI